MSGQRRRRLDMRTWREVMRRFDASGASVDEFCAREAVSVSSFYRWRARVGSADEVGPAAHLRAVQSLPVQPTGAGFIDLGKLGNASRERVDSLDLRLDLGGGVVLQIVRR